MLNELYEFYLEKKNLWEENRREKIEKEEERLNAEYIGSKKQLRYFIQQGDFPVSKFNNAMQQAYNALISKSNLEQRERFPSSIEGKLIMEAEL